MRLDKYLKVSRLIKRRTVANNACDAGRVSINGKPAKASTAVKVGDILEMDLPQNFYDVVICLNFFPHLHTRKEEFLRKMNCTLKNGGSLIVMHDISRETVNNIHRESEVVAEHRLPEAKVVGEIFQACGYQNIHAYEDDTMYFVKGCK